MILKGKKVILRPIKLSDAPAIVKWSRDPEVTKFLSMGKRTLPEERQWIMDKSKNKDEKIFAIETLDHKHIGNTGLHLNLKNKKAGFGIFIGDKNYWSCGYGTDATKMILDYGFKKFKLHKIFLDVYDYNQRAINLYLNMGFELAGIKKDDRLRNNKFYNAYYMELLSKNWN
jgi:RimJ/RimL family protein N-acetyltransferase